MVIHDNLNDLIVVEDEGVREFTIHHWICSIVTRRHDRVKGRNFWGYIGNVLEESTRGNVRMEDQRIRRGPYYGFPSPRLPMTTSSVIT